MADLSISYSRTGEVHTLHTGSPVIGDLVIDYTDVPDDQRGGTAKQLLASATLYCFCAAVAKALQTRGAVYEKITATASLETGVDDKKRARVTKIAIEVTIHMDEEYEFIFDRVEKIMQQGCLITASLDAAFPVTYKLHHEF